MADALSINQMITGLMSTAMGYATLVVVLLILGKWVTVALSRALIPVLRDADEDKQRSIIKFLVNRRLTLRELYAEMKAEDSAGLSP